MRTSLPLAAGLGAIFLSGCLHAQTPPALAPATKTVSLLEARRGFKTVITSKPGKGDPAEVAPPKVFRTVSYPSAAGSLKAYVTPDPKDGKRHPAIVWITGGDCNSIGDVWSPASPDNDQNADQFRTAGITMMFPSLRGGNDNPGIKEGFLGEVDDVLAATDWLQKQPYVDPNRIYLGGHSTGGTLAMLVAECSYRYRDVFAYGPVADVAGYGQDSGFTPFDINDKTEDHLRSPGYWLNSIHSPVWVLEGTSQGNIESLEVMRKISTNPKVHFVAIKGATHFSTLAPTNRLLAQKILADTGATTNINLTEDELAQNFAKK